MTMTSAARGSLLAFRRACQGGSGRVFGNASVFSGGIMSSSTGAAAPLAQATHIYGINANDVNKSRYFSSAPDRKDLLRVHAVSLYEADYDDDEEPRWQDEDEGSTSYLEPREGRKADADEEEDWWLYDGTQESRDALAAMRAKEAQKNKWLQNARPPVRVSEIDERGRAYGRGSRKSAQARVWIQPGVGEVVVNRKDFLSYFPRETDREHVVGPFVASQTCGKFDVTVAVKGGGLTGQAGAIRLGIARALEKWNPDYRPPMKRHGFMTRDPRMVERKKIGRVKARKSPQWVRR